MTTEEADASVCAVVRAAEQTLAAAGVPSPRSDARALAAFALDVDRGELERQLLLRSPADEAFRDRYAGLVEERAERVPLQHLTGWAGFRNLELRVGPGVFVPRPETESVAGWAIDAARAAAGHRTLRRSKCGPGDAYCDVAGEEDEQAEARTARPPVVVDLCTGSGAIALSIKDEVPAAKVYAVELSPEAHAWALANRDRLGLEVEIRLGDAITAFGDLEGAVDVVVSNPPYIPTGAVPVDPEVRDHDPRLALYGGSADGLAIPRLVAARAAHLLRPGGVLVMEHADTQGETLPAALTTAGDWTGIEDLRDLTGRPRATVARRR